MTNQPSPNPSMLGARIRPPDPREVKYRLIAPTLPDMTKPVSIAGFMSPVGDSQNGGSCTGHTVAGIMDALYAITRSEWPRRVDPYVAYWLARLRANWFGGPVGGDTGAYLADAFDVALEGLPYDDLWPTPDRMDEAPPADVLATAPQNDWLLGHQPMYASDPGGLVAGIWTAIGNFQPVGIATAWYNRWFGSDGILPDVSGDLAGYHAIKAYACIPAGWLHPDALVVLRNSWGGYTDVSQLKSVIPEAEPGDVAIPARWFENGTVQEARAATAEAIPMPEPEPTPDCTDEAVAARDAAIASIQRALDAIKAQGG